MKKIVRLLALLLTFLLARRLAMSLSRPIAAMGAAFALAAAAFDDEKALIVRLRERLLDQLLGIPGVTPENADSFWTTRKQWFFKPEAGFGSKATYSGDKVTKRVFEEIAQGGFIAQAVVPPSERTLRVDGVEQRLKLDLRNFVYRDGVQLV